MLPVDIEDRILKGGRDFEKDIKAYFDMKRTAIHKLCKERERDDRDMSCTGKVLSRLKQMLTGSKPRVLPAVKDLNLQTLRESGDFIDFASLHDFKVAALTPTGLIYVVNLKSNDV